MSKEVYNVLTNCRICKTDKIIDVINIGEQAITSRFPILGDYSTPTTPIDLCLCQNCGLLQLKQSTKSQELYEHEYGYRSGISNTMKTHLKLYQEEIVNKAFPKENNVVLDIGSNDSTMLQYYSSKYKKIGIDPTGKQFKQYYTDDIDLIENYFTKENFQKIYGDLKCNIVSSISMFYDLPDPVQFVKDIYDILDDDGIWTCEQSYVISMLKQNSFDTICHEHLEYYGLHQIKQIAEMANMKIIDVNFNDCNGGSFRIYMCKKESNAYKINTEYINKILKDELEYGLFNIDTYENFIKNCKKEMDKLCNLIDTINNNGKEIWIYGASTKGNCLLQYGNITKDKIKYAVERNPNKIGKMTVTGIEIISEEKMRENPPEYLLVLPWHFRNEIIERENEFLENGGKLVFPLPNLEVYSKKEKVLITGCNGHIASYLMEQLSSDKYSLYGICKTFSQKSNIMQFIFDLCDKQKLENTILTINPNIIIHLAGITSSVESYNNPNEAININGMITVNVCDIIHKYNLKTKLFNASSSEIYKGHINYTVKENDNNMYHNHPYSIGKILSHSIVDFYRNTYKLPFSNGILFTIESPRKTGNFLLNKVANHAKKWHINKRKLTLGSLNAYRNLLHAKDACRAIELIINMDYGDNYLICNDDYSIKIIDIVFKIYKLCGIELVYNDNKLFEKNSGEIVIDIQDCDNGLDKNVVNIRGSPNKLKSLSWKPQISIDNILSEIVNSIT